MTANNGKPAAWIIENVGALLAPDGLHFSLSLHLPGQGRDHLWEQPLRERVGPAWEKHPACTAVLSLAREPSLVEAEVPALRQAGYRFAAEPRILLLSKSGYTDGLRRAAEARPDIQLVDVKATLGSHANPT